MTHPEMTTEPDPQAFQRWVDAWPKGMLGLELAEELASCVEATQLHDKPSVLTLKVTIAPGRGVAGELDVTADVTAKPAQAPRPIVAFFATPEGGLTRDDPGRQGHTQPIPFQDRP